MSAITEVQRKVQAFASENASTLLTAGGVVGTVATAVLSGRAGVKAQQIIQEEEARREQEQEGAIPMLRKEKVLHTGAQFIAPVVTGSLTIAMIILANRISAKEAAALAAAYGLSKQQLEDYKAKVAEKLTGPKNQQVKDEIAQDKIDADPVSKQVVIIAGGDVLCYDTLSGRYFRSSMENIKRVENELNQELFDTQMVSMSEYYDKLGLKPTGMSDVLGWNAFEDGVLELEVTTGESENHEPCFIITPSRTPEPRYNRLHAD